MGIRRPAGFCLVLLLALGFCACGESEKEARPPEVIVDENGMVHIYADNDEELFYAAGYQMATDRLFQMAMLRRFAYGRLAEVVGELGLVRDRQARLFNLPFWGRQDAQATAEADPERAALVSAWVRGINQRIVEIRNSIAPLPFGYGPDEFDFLPELWAEEDPYIVLKGANFALDKTIEFEIAVTLITELFPDAIGAVDVYKPTFQVFGIPPEDRPGSRVARRSRRQVPERKSELTPEHLEGLQRLVRSSPRPKGSNNWVVSGRFTETGRPVICGDPHMGFDFFGSPYPLHLNSKDRGGTYNVAGFAFPGTPGIALGFNEKFIWAVTSAFGDVNDIWYLERSGENGVVIGDQVVGARARTEQFIIRDQQAGDPAGAGRTEEMLYEDVDNYGVVIPKEIIGLPAGPFLMNWTGFVPRPARWFMELNRVGSIDEFEQTVDRMREMNYNFIGADADGIAYRIGLDVPDRPDVSGDRNPTKAMLAGDQGSLWTGEMLPGEQLPRSRAPQQGWISTANNDPFGFTADGDLANDPWFYGGFFAPGYRAKRITDEIERLTARGGITVADMQALQMDTYSVLADNLLGALSEAYANLETDDALAEFRDRPDLDRVVELITNEWDRRMDRDSAGALAFQAFMHKLMQGVVVDDITLMGYSFVMGLQAIFMIKIADMAIRGEYPNGDNVLQEGRDWLLLNAVADTVDYLTARFGGVDPSGYQYSDLKRVSLDDGYGYGLPLFRVPKDGGEDTVNVSQNISFLDKNGNETDEWVSTYVSVERSVGSFKEDGSPEVWVQFPLGAHADPDSPETARANDDWINGNYRKFLFDREEIEAAAVEQFGIELRD